MSIVGIRRFTSEINNLVGRIIEVRTSLGRTYIGRLSAIDPEKLNMILTEVSSNGNKYHAVVLNGSNITEILLKEKPFDMRALVERLEKIFPKMVRYDESARLIIVAERVKVGEQGVVEGAGPIAEKVKSIYDQYIREIQ
ncbi:MAG: Lsm family RNA-binding protein [Thermoprotei archaeon]